MEGQWNEVVSRKTKQAIAQQTARENLKGRYEVYFNENQENQEVEGMVESDASEDEDTQLSLALHEMNNLPINPRPPDKDVSQEDLAQIEKDEREYLERSYTSRSPWTRGALIFNENPVFSKEDLKIPYFKEVASSGVAILDETDYIPIRKGWGICLLGIFAGRFPGREAVFQLMKRWNVKARVSFHRKGWMLFQFASETDLERTRQAGPFSQFGIPLILQPVPEDFKFDMAPQINIPVWIRLVDLEPYYWHENAIGKIASLVGVPVGADFKSLRKESMDWPRVQVIIDASAHQKDSVKVIDKDGVEFHQKIEFEYVPKFCKTCKVFGHYSDGCPGPEMRKKIPTQQAKSHPQQGRVRPESRPGRPPPQQANAPPQQGRNRSLSRQGRAPQQHTQPPHKQGRNRTLSRPGRPPIRETQPQQNKNRSKSRGTKPIGAVRYGWAVQPTEEEIKKHGYKKNWLDAEGKVIIHKDTNYPFLAGRGYRHKSKDPQPSKPPQEAVTSPNRFQAIANGDDLDDEHPQPVLGAAPPVSPFAQIQDKQPVISTHADENGIGGDHHDEQTSPIHGVIQTDAEGDHIADEENITCDLFSSPPLKTNQKQADKVLPPKPNQHLYFSDKDEEEGNCINVTPPHSKHKSAADSSDDEEQHEQNVYSENVPEDSLVIGLRVPTSSEKRMGRRQRERDKKRQLLAAQKRVTRSSSIPLAPGGCVTTKSSNIPK